MSAQIPGDRVRLSVAVFADDVERALPPTLESVEEIADEIVVLDCSAGNRTAQVAHDFGARVIHHEWTDDYSAARNHCWNELRGDWVLWLDAGERLSSRCVESLRRFLQARPANNKAYLLMVEMPAEHSSGMIEQAGRPRLLPNASRLRHRGRVRETVMPSLAELGMSVALGPWRILRSEPAAAVKEQQARRDLKLVQIEIQETGPSARLLLAQAEAIVALGDPAQASDWFRQAIALAARGSTEMLSAYYGLLTSCQPENPSDNRQLEVCIEALEIFPYDAQLLCAMGSYLQGQGHLGLAQRSYRAAHQFGQVNPETWHCRGIGEIAATCLSLNLQLVGDDAAALQVLEEARVRHPNSAALARRRLELLIKSNRVDEALAETARLRLDAPQVVGMQAAVRGACHASRSDWPMALRHLKEAYDAGCRDAVALRWYTIALYATGSYGQAREILQQWSTIEPQCAELAHYRTAIEEAANGDSSLGDHRQPHRGMPIVPAPHMHLQSGFARTN